LKLCKLLHNYKVLRFVACKWWPNERLGAKLSKCLPTNKLSCRKVKSTLIEKLDISLKSIFLSLQVCIWKLSIWSKMKKLWTSKVVPIHKLIVSRFLLGNLKIKCHFHLAFTKNYKHVLQRKSWCFFLSLGHGESNVFQFVRGLFMHDFGLKLHQPLCLFGLCNLTWWWFQLKLCPNLTPSLLQVHGFFNNNIVIKIILKSNTFILND